MLKKILCLMIYVSLLSANYAYAETQPVNFTKLYQSLAKAKSVSVKAWGLSSCSYSTSQPEAIKQLADILKRAQIKPMPENLWFYGGTRYQNDRFANKGDTSALFTLADGSIADFRFDRYYLNETTIDAALIFQEQQAMMSADFHIHRDITLWVQQHELPPETAYEKTDIPAYFLDMLFRGEVYPYVGGESAVEEYRRSEAEQDRDRYTRVLAECRWESKVIYYRTSPQQICEWREFPLTLDGEFCLTGWELPKTEDTQP